MSGRLPSRVWIGSTLVCALVCACGITDALQGHEPCWPEEPDFMYEPMTLEGVIQVARMAPDDYALFIALPNGRKADLSWPGGFTYRFGPGLEGEVVAPHSRLPVAASGQHVTLWGALVREETSPRAPAAPGMDGFSVCLTNGVAFTPPPVLPGETGTP